MSEAKKRKVHSSKFKAKEGLLVSIIIPFQQESQYLAETLRYLDRLNYGAFEVVLLPDEEMSREYLDAHTAISRPVIVIPTGPVSPAIKRDKGVEACSGDVVAFIDDDAYPDSAWLDAALRYFDDPGVAAVGGPQLTPESDGFWQQVSGAMFLSPLNGGAVCRYWPCSGVRDVDDWPSVNLVVRRQDFLAIGGFDSSYWPGEDTKLCHDLVSRGRRIVCAGDALVYHHRRAGFRRHMRQVGNYGLHRGHFARVFPGTSLRPGYIMPSLFFLFVTLGWVGLLLSRSTAAMWIVLASIYGAAQLFSAWTVYGRTKRFAVSLMTIPYLTATHFWYGWRFLHGFFSFSLKSSLGR